MALLEWKVGRRKLLKPEDREELLGIPDDETSLILHYTLTLADRLEVKLLRRIHSKLGFALVAHGARCTRCG
jgi:hypothetical protein